MTYDSQLERMSFGQRMAHDQAINELRSMREREIMIMRQHSIAGSMWVSSITSSNDLTKEEIEDAKNREPLLVKDLMVDLEKLPEEKIKEKI